MKLLVVSDAAHYGGTLRGDELRGYGPVVRELDELATLFESIVHVAPLHNSPAPPHARPYQSDRIRVRAISPAGGQGILVKLGIAARIPGWVRSIRAELRDADAVHIRCPANVSLIAVLVVMLSRRPMQRWVKYGGNWSPPERDAMSYRLQRWLLRHNACRGAVTVNGAWPAQPAHVHDVANPTLTEEELRAAARTAGAKPMDGRLRIVFAGRLDVAKGARRVMMIAERLAARGLPFHLAVAGDGPEQAWCAQFVDEHALTDRVTFHGWVDREALDSLFASAHVVLLPSAASEGFPKVLAEAMAHGVVPLAGDVSCIGQVLADAGTGAALSPHHIDAFVDAVADLTDEAVWQRASVTAIAAAPRFTYSRYLSAIRELVPSAAPLRIGVFGPHLGSNPGWVVSQGELLVRLLAESGHEVHEASHRPARVARALDIAATLARHAGRLDVAIIAVYSGPSFAMAEMTAAIARLRRVPIVLVLHGGALPEFARQHPARVRRLLAHADEVVAPSPFLARELARLNPAITVIPNGLPLARYPASTRSPARPALLWMRTFEPMYRPHLALRTLAALRASHPNATLTLAGQDRLPHQRALREEIQRQSGELGVADVVRFAGFLDADAKLQAFADHDVFLSTNEVDNAPVGVLEAAASGLVVVATDAGGIRDLVTDGVNALVVADDGADTMAAAVRRVLDDPALAGSLSQHAPQLAASSSHAAIATSWDALLKPFR